VDHLAVEEPRLIVELGMPRVAFVMQHESTSPARLRIPDHAEPATV
jgi:hypothetical protein